MAITKSKKWQWVFLLFGLCVLILCPILIIGALNIYDSLILDNKDFYLICEDLPTVSEVEATMVAHKEVVEAIKQVNPDSVLIEIVEDANCVSKAYFVINYTTHEERVEIEGIIGGERFFGIPYQLRNR